MSPGLPRRRRWNRGLCLHFCPRAASAQKLGSARPVIHIRYHIKMPEDDSLMPKRSASRPRSYTDSSTPAKGIEVSVSLA
jgi:hypothetical protein